MSRNVFHSLQAAQSEAEALKIQNASLRLELSEKNCAVKDKQEEIERLKKQVAFTVESYSDTLRAKNDEVKYLARFAAAQRRALLGVFRNIPDASPATLLGIIDGAVSIPVPPSVEAVLKEKL